MIQLHGIRYAIGPRILFEDLDWVLGPGDRVALVGPNGGRQDDAAPGPPRRVQPPRRARAVLTRGTRIGYLPQEAAEKFEGTVLDRALEAHRAVLDMREELDLLHGQLAGISPRGPRTRGAPRARGRTPAPPRDDGRARARARGAARPLRARVRARGPGTDRSPSSLRRLAHARHAGRAAPHPTRRCSSSTSRRTTSTLPAMEWLEDYLEDFPRRARRRVARSACS